MEPDIQNFKFPVRHWVIFMVLSDVADLASQFDCSNFLRFGDAFLMLFQELKKKTDLYVLKSLKNSKYSGVHSGYSQDIYLDSKHDCSTSFDVLDVTILLVFENFKSFILQKV